VQRAVIGVDCSRGMVRLNMMLETCRGFEFYKVKVYVKCMKAVRVIDPQRTKLNPSVIRVTLVASDVFTHNCATG
jgi:hypothetical protein